MAIDTDELRALPAAEKLRLVEWLWDDLCDSTEPIPLPEWVGREAARRLEEMRDPDFGLSHEEVWMRIDERND
jgi:putative addiction module component (TIGR02574 family)